MPLTCHWSSSRYLTCKIIAIFLVSILCSSSLSALTVTPNPSSLGCGTTTITFTFDCAFSGTVFFSSPTGINFPTLSPIGGSAYIEPVVNGVITFDVNATLSAPTSFNINFNVLSSDMGCAPISSVAAAFTLNCTPPANNDCANAKILAIGTNSCTPSSYATLNSTFSGQTPATCGLNPLSGYLDLWYTFNANNTIIDLEIPTYPGLVAFYALYDNCPGSGGNEIECGILFGATTSKQLTGLTLGTDYILQMIYQVTYEGTDQELCLHSTTAQPPCPTVGSLVGTTSICSADNTTTLTATGLTNMGSIYGVDFVYFTSPQSGATMYGTPVGTLGTITNGNLTSGTSAVLNNVVYPTSAGTYYVYAIITPLPGSTSCRPFATTTVTVIRPNVTLPSPQIICEDEMTTTVTFAGSGTSYDWTNNNTAIGLPASGTSVSSIPAFTADNGTASPIIGNIIVIPKNGTCTGSYKTFSYTVNPKISSAAISGSANIINGQSTDISVTITGGIGPYTLVYTDGSNNITEALYASGSNITVSPNSSVTYSLVSVTDANACVSQSNTGSAVINVMDGPGLCLTNRIVTDNPSIGTYRASQTIETSGTVEVTTSSEYRAGTSITLNQGFEVNSGSDFLAIIESCTPFTETETKRNYKKIVPATSVVGDFSYKIVPNPFKESTELILDLKVSNKVSAEVYNQQGQLVKSLFEDQ